MKELNKNNYLNDRFLCCEGEIYKLEKETEYGYIARDGEDRVVFFNKKNLSCCCSGGNGYKETKYGYLIDKFTYLEFLNKTFNRKCQLNYGYRDIEETDAEYEARVRPSMNKFVGRVDELISQVIGNGEVPALYDYISRIPDFGGYSLTFTDGRNIAMSNDTGVINAPFGEIFRGIRGDWYIFDKDTERVSSVVRSETLPCIRFKGEDSFYALYDKEKGEWQYITDVCDKTRDVTFIRNSNGKAKKKSRVKINK